MKIFGFNIKWNSPADQVVVRTVKPTTAPISKTPTIKIGSLSYAQQFARGRGQFVSGEYDLSEIGVAEDTDNYIRQSFKKKEGLMFKEGFSVKGPNKDTVRYYKTRMAQIARATNIPEKQLLKRIARSLIRTSNAFLVKVRKAQASGGQTRITANGKVLQPVAGYFPAAPETMRVDLDQDTGKIRGWRQVLPDGRWRDYKVEDVIHFYIDRREGFLFGIPTLIPVFDDIRALRQIEENIELLLYQHIFPLFHYKVGTETAPAGYTEDGTKEVDAVEEQVRLMPSEGAIVTPERHEIRAIGAEGRAVRAEGYLEHFKKRVFAGLGVSEVDMGDGQTANRATANVLSRALIDSVKAIQDDLEAQWDHHVISELLMESTFGDHVLEEDMMVHLKFAEIDIQNKMEMESHAIELWKANGITYDEFRAELGYEPIRVPDDPEDQDMSKYPEWSLTYWKLIEEPMNLVRSVDEPFSPVAQATAQARGTALTTKALATAQEQRQKDKDADEQRQARLVQKQQSTRQTKDNFLASSFKELEEDTQVRLQNNLITRGHIDRDYLLSAAKVWGTDASQKLYSLAASEFIRGFNHQTGNQANMAETLVSTSRSTIRNRIDFYVDSLVTHTIGLVAKRVDEHLADVKLSEATPDVLNELHTAFDSVRYRIDLIWDVELRKAYTFGRVMGMRFVGNQGIELQAHPESCEQCQAMDGYFIKADFATIDDVPPFHPHSRMSFMVKKINNE